MLLRGFQKKTTLCDFLISKFNVNQMGEKVKLK